MDNGQYLSIFFRKIIKGFLNRYIMLFIKLKVLRSLINQGDNLKDKQAYKNLGTFRQKNFLCISSFHEATVTPFD